MRRVSMLVIAVLMLSLSAATALADHGYVFPSTNDVNREANRPHVNFVSNAIGEVTLEFVNDTNSLAFFEIRVDGNVQTTGTDHPVVHGDKIYPGVSVESRNIPEPVIVTRTFQASEYVEVRLALGGERDWDFDWVRFDALPDAQTQDDCKDGGWEAYGFKNQGQCIRFVNTGKDSR